MLQFQHIIELVTFAESKKQKQSSFVRSFVRSRSAANIKIYCPDLSSLLQSNFPDTFSDHTGKNWDIKEEKQDTSSLLVKLC